jgi:PPOX class probable F420-dependent enzyme
MLCCMTDKAQAALDLCRTKALAYIGTVDPDGQPQVTPVWVDVREGKPAFNTALGRAKARNLEHDPRVTLAIADPDNPQRYVDVCEDAPRSPRMAPTSSSTTLRRSTSAWTRTRTAHRTSGA